MLYEHNCIEVRCVGSGVASSASHYYLGDTSATSSSKNLKELPHKNNSSQIKLIPVSRFEFTDELSL